MQPSAFMLLEKTAQRQTGQGGWHQSKAVTTRPSCEAPSCSEEPSVEIQARGFLWPPLPTFPVWCCQKERTPNTRADPFHGVTHQHSQTAFSPQGLQRQTGFGLLYLSFPAPLTPTANSHQLQKGELDQWPVSHNYCSFCFYVVWRPLFFFFWWKTGNKGAYYIVKYQS